jgi:glutathione S-transferase
MLSQSVGTIAPPHKTNKQRRKNLDKLQIIGAPQSIYVWTTCIVCAEKGVPYTLTPSSPHTPEVDAIHPYGKIPVIRHGDFTVGESLAICGYVDQAFDGPSLTPVSPKQRAKIAQWVSLIITAINPVLIGRYLVGYAFPRTPDGAIDQAAIDAAWPDVKPHLEVLEKAVADGYLANGAFSLADAYLVPILYFLRLTPEAGAAIDASGPLTAYLEKHTARPSVRETIPPLFPVEGSAFRKLQAGELRQK